ncbi:MAG: hypothetical protein K2X81_28840 [Candidatus Obscuribacterales bacterium]|nr:hypothetical protein [Candidatus Obscuribacterales bacterium]
MSLYPNRVKAILRPPGCKNWTTVSKHWPIPDETIASAIAGQEKSTWGLRWGPQTLFAVLDIDAGSKYHNAQALQKLQEKLAAVGLIGTLYRSSESGGWHLYLFMDDWVCSEDIHDTLKAWLTWQGYEIRNGTLELFPCNNGLRLPLQAGCAWLNKFGDLVKLREELTTEEALMRFWVDAQSRSNNWQDCRNQIASQLIAKSEHRPGSAQEREERLNISDFDHVFNYRLIQEKYEEGRKYWQNGLTASGLRHDAILSIGHYLWHGDPAGEVPAMPGQKYEKARYRLILAWLEKKHNGFCRYINRGKWSKVEAEIRRAVCWRRASDANRIRTPYALTDNAIEVLIARYKSTGRIWSMEDLKKGNDRSEAEARKRIREAFQFLVAQGRRVTVRQLKNQAKCHYNTLQKNKDIWSISLEFPLSRVSGDCSSFIGGSGSSFDELAGLRFRKALAEEIALAIEEVVTPKMHAEIVIQEKCYADRSIFEQVSYAKKAHRLLVSRSEIFGLYPALQRAAASSMWLSVLEKCEKGKNSKERAPIVVAPPFLLCLASEPTTCTQHQDQALRVPSEVLTPGPVQRGLQAELQESAGGLELSRRRQRTVKPVSALWECGRIVSLTGLIAVTTCYHSVKIVLQRRYKASRGPPKTA